MMSPTTLAKPANMATTRGLHVIVVPLVYLVGQVLTGTDLKFALTTSFAILFGLLAVSVAGGIGSAFGALNAIMITGILLFGIAVKVVSLQAADSILLAPQDTALVMCLGFAGALAGTWLQRDIPIPLGPLFPVIRDPRMYLALAIASMTLGAGGFVIGIGPELAGNGIQTGGILGIARAFSNFSEYAVIFAMFYAWSIRSPRYLSHPLVLGFLVADVSIGIFSTSKEAVIAPLAFYLLMAVVRYGLKDKRIWAIGLSGAFFYAGLVYPYSQYVRVNGGKQGDASSRLKAVTDVVIGIVTDPSFRALVYRKIAAPKQGYLNVEPMTPFERFAMIGPADLLVSGTNSSAFTGWKTITWGFELMVPSFLYPDKPIQSAGNYLGHIAGEASPIVDDTTQFSYGMMANFYCAFSFTGAFLGTAIFIAIFHYILRLSFGHPRYSRQAAGSTAWFLLIVAHFHHSILELAVSGIMPDIVMFPLLVAVLYFAAKGLVLFMDATSLGNSVSVSGRNLLRYKSGVAGVHPV